MVAVPDHAWLIETMFAYDVVGFQTSSDVTNFQRYVLEQADGVLKAGGQISAFGRTIVVRNFPIGIDVDAIKNMAHTPKADASIQLLATRTLNRAQIIGVDRLDYTKGLPDRFRAFRRLLELYPEHLKRVILMQIAPPTREEVAAYVDIREELEGLSGNINGEFGDFDWTPVRYIHRSIERDILAALFRGSKAGLVTPLRDGMNLVAKEYIAAQDDDDPGVLILSRFAGAAEDLEEALIVNPYDMDDVATAMQRALKMPLAERIERHRALIGPGARARRHALARAVPGGAEQFAATVRRMSPRRLVADAGGTNVRFAIADAEWRARSRQDISRSRTSRHSWTRLSAYRSDAGGLQEIDACAIAAAGPVDGDAVKLTNNEWIVDRARISAMLNGVPVALVNDLEAVAAALPHLAVRGFDRDRRARAGPAGTAHDAGGQCRHRLWRRQRHFSRRPMVHLPERSRAHDARPRRRRWPPCPRRQASRTCCPAAAWPGCTSVWPAAGGAASAADVFAEAGRDAAAARTVALFTAILGRIAGDLTLATCAWGGVYLCGSVATAWSAIADSERFRAEFIRKGPMRARMLKVPTAVIRRDNAALYGLAMMPISR